MLKAYYRLTKPGIIYGNLVSAVAGFFLASALAGKFSPGTFLAMLVGLALVIGSACVFNNYLDREIDAKMERTRKRALVSGQIPVLKALVYGSLLGLVGLGVLIAWTNVFTAAVALTGWGFYVVVYGYFKRVSVHGTLVGSISGATPPVVGYAAVSGNLGGYALVLFLMLVFWQMPHFYSIAIYRSKDYAAAKIPVLPLVKGVATTKKIILIYIAAFIVMAWTLGVPFFILMLLAGGYWLRAGYRGLSAADSNKWARKMFGLSLVVLLIWSASITLFSIVSLLVD